ncbi:MAG TPA: ECF transporter S component [Erysipelotrichaceae bacterium]|uniref:ECF transporter S component n=1 Tax=Sharpea azabuensis TaxID=322505 RepID=UPI000E8B960B|nr:ECF transporter S component [Sharpea azabuensis]HAJ15547.1 ECF transporter S component [Erysipelotrichaceae bacterium]HAV17803.1 ECF transporter S component [Erysipelotrichaceae bacterium]HBG84995.1 ECF transporter S component [Erysipelotrichaceae bacterium]HBZ51916.1 ECF transporter S component [Erysipelotrichaceae bacterium]HBZ88972.1 ECF transporter S component [Erysipelotrichaceae bacterium]
MTKTKRLVTGALMLALGMVLPFVTMHIPFLGVMLSPMHIPALLTGFLCGPALGLLIGFIMPLLRSVLFGMPAFYPNAMSMAFELATYGFVSGFIYHRWKTQNLKKVYLTLLVSMLLGRIIWGITRVVMLGMMKTPFSWQIFIADGFIRAIPAIILQLILIPFILDRLNQARILPYK